MQAQSCTTSLLAAMQKVARGKCIHEQRKEKKRLRLMASIDENPSIVLGSPVQYWDSQYWAAQKCSHDF